MSFQWVLHVMAHGRRVQPRTKQNCYCGSTTSFRVSTMKYLSRKWHKKSPKPSKQTPSLGNITAGPSNSGAGQVGLPKGKWNLSDREATLI